VVSALRITVGVALLATTLGSASCLAIVGGDQDYRQAGEPTGGAASGNGGSSSSGDGAGATGGNTDAMCGNGRKEAGEDCDGSDLGVATCASTVGAVSSGTLICTNGCTFDTDGCSVCGNELKEEEEECDTEDYGGGTCTTVVGQHAGGSLSCSGTCEINSSGCLPCGLPNFVVPCGADANCPQNSTCSGNPPGSTCTCLAGFLAITCDGQICEGADAELCFDTTDWYCG
jgi:hypothetical protein